MSKTPHVHEGHRKRLRENVLKNGLENMQEHQVLEYVLSFILPRKDTNVIAHNLIRKFRCFKGVLQSSPKELQTVNGVGEVLAIYLSTLKDVINYYNKSAVQNNIKVFNTLDTAHFFSNLLATVHTEEFYVACVNSKNQITYHQKLSCGSDTKVIVKIKDILNILNKNLCTNFIVAHNHPAGKAQPSLSDVAFTKNLYISAQLAGFTLLDHIIIAGQNFYSFRDEGDFSSFDKLIDSLHLN